MKYSFSKNLYVCLLIALFAPKLAAQVTVKASMDSASIFIGEQTSIHLEVTQPKGEFVEFPLLSDTIVNGLELLSISNIDTISNGDNRITLKQDLLVTSFDSALYYLPAFEFVAGNDTLLTNSLALKVNTYDVDVEKEEFYDIKPILSAPFVWRDYFWEIFGVLFGLFIIVWSIYFYKRWKFRKDHPELIEMEESKLPPFEAAMEALSSLKDKKLWQQGLEKEYYTSLTDILRQYIDGRFHVNAMEMTSNEILDVLKNEEATKSAIDNLRQVLLLADFVKFAKLKPGYDENDLSMMNAQMFVSQTKEVVVMDTTQAADTDEEVVEEN